MVTPGRLELPTRSLGNCCSIHLSYGATFCKLLLIINLLQFSGFVAESVFLLVADFSDHLVFAYRGFSAPARL